MKICLGLLLALLCSQRGAMAAADARQVSVANFDPDGPPCVVAFAGDAAACGADTCVLSPSAIEVHLSCVPPSAPNGFERPAPEVKVQSIRTRNVRGHLSVVDTPEGATLKLNFCLYGTLNTLCGFATYPRPSGGASAAAVKAFLRGVELR